MKNLKRILSLALAGTMLVGMMVVGASAAEFGDAADISHPKAVKTLNTLGIINGYGGEENLFGPNDTLTRAQMATMIATIMNGGNQWNFKPESYKFQDVSSHWAAASIAYCSDLKIVNGYSDTMFGPEDTLTTTQALRMILNAMGYTEYAGSWDLATEVQALELGLYAGLDQEKIAGQKISRDNVAQIIYTALTKPLNDANVVTTTTHTLTWTENGVAKKEVFTSITDAYLFISAKNLATVDPTYVLTSSSSTSTESLASKYLKMASPSGTLTTVVYDEDEEVYNTTIGGVLYELDEDLSDMIGHNVTVLSKGSKISGVVDNGTVLYTGRYKDYSFSNNTLKLGGTAFGYSTNDAGAANYVTNVWNTGATGSYNGWDEMIAIDNTGNNKVDMIVVKPVTVNKITVGKTTFSITGLISGAKLADHEIDEDLKTGDWVVATADIYGTVTAEAAPVVEGVRYTKAGNGTYLIGGVTYKVAPNYTLTNTPALGNEYDLVAYQGFIFESTNASSGSAAVYSIDDVVYVLQGANGTTPNGNFTNTTYTYDVQVLNQDGTVEVVAIDTFEGTDLTGNKPTVNPGLYFLTIDEDGVVDLTTFDEDELKMVPGNTVSTSSKIDDGKLANTLIDDDALFYVTVQNMVASTPGGAKDTPKVMVVSGKTVAGWDVPAGDIASGAIYTQKGADGFDYITLGVLVGASNSGSLDGKTPDASSDYDYGYITAAISNEYLPAGDEVATKGNYFRISIWNGVTEEDYFLADTTANRALVATLDTFVSFKASNNLLSVISDLPATPDAITALNATEFRTGLGVGDKIEDTIVIYINDKDGEPGDETGLQLANLSLKDGVAYDYNVYTAVGQVGETILFVDSNNEIATQPKEISNVTKVPAKDKDAAGNDVTPNLGKAFSKAGVYTVSQAVIDGTHASAWRDDNNDPLKAENLLIIAYSATGNVTYTLDVENSAGAPVYHETAAITGVPANGSAMRVFAIDITGTDAGAGYNGQWNVAPGTSDTYYYTITATVNNNPVSITGIFEFTTPAAQQ